jgi:hypothetical protein
MKFRSKVHLKADGETIRRDPGFWERVGKLFGASPNLDTTRVRTNLSAAHLLSGVKKALERAGVDNAIALTIDGQVLFDDRTGQAGDLVDLFTAFYENEMVYGRDFKQLILTVEHTEAGVHHVIELEARGEHERDEATVLLDLSGRITEFEPRKGEDADAFRARVEPHLATPAFAETHRLQFESFVERLRDALAAGLPEVKVERPIAETVAVRPGKARGSRRGAGQGAPARPARGQPGYDPYEQHYPSHGGDLTTLLFWHSMMHWSWHPGYVVTDTSGEVLGTADAMAADGAREAADAGDLAGEAGADGLGVDDAGGDAGDFGDAADASDLGDVGGGDFEVPDVDPGGFDLDFFDF